MKVAASAPAMPRMAVSQNPEGPVPGVTALAIKPARKPIRIVQIQCSICGHLRVMCPWCQDIMVVQFKSEQPDQEKRCVRFEAARFASGRQSLELHCRLA